MPPQNMIFSQNHEITRGRGILQEAPRIQKRHQVIDLLNYADILDGPSTPGAPFVIGLLAL
jgi:hypothetical protein